VRRHGPIRSRFGSGARLFPIRKRARSVECWAAQLPSNGSPLIGVGYIGRHRNTVDGRGGRRIENRVIVYYTQSAAQHAAQVKLVCCLFVIYSDIQLFPLFRYSDCGPRKPLPTRRQVKTHFPLHNRPIQSFTRDSFGLRLLSVMAF
jgi:hypothetical protein